MKTYSSLVLAALATSVAAPAALARDFGNGFSLTGEVQLEYLTDGDDEETYAFTDLTLGWRSQGNGALSFGVDIGIEDIRVLSGNDNLSMERASLVLVTSAGELAIGRPKPVLAGMFTTPEIGGAKLIDLELSFFAGSILESLIFVNDVEVIGMTFQGSAGDLGYGLGYHDVGDMVDAKVLEAGITYTMGQSTLFAGIERAEGISVSDITKLSLGATHDGGRWSAGALVSRSSSGSDDATLLMVFGDYEVMDAFTVGVQLTKIDTGMDSANLIGLTTEYGFGEGGFAGLGYMHTDDTFDEDLFTASVGYRF